MRSTPLQNFSKMNIKPNSNPIGTTQIVRSQSVDGGYNWHKYKVISITGHAPFAPNAEPIVHMELVERQPGHLQQFVSLPLNAFDQRVMSNTPEDQFWTSPKGVELNQEEA